LELDAVFEENIALIKVYPGMQPTVMEHYVQNGCKGFIIEGTGLGHVPENWSPFIAKLSAKGIPIFSTSQAPYGRTNLNVYSAGRVTQEAGLVGLEDMLPEVAYVKLGWILAHTQKLEDVRKMMLTDYAGELTTRTEEDTFLY
jgi:glutamyl-tRNA(Gln) amidotransferase subunit D